MTVETATFYRVKCGECGEPCPGDGEHDWWESSDSAEEVALASEFRCEGEDGHLCSDCWLQRWGDCDE